MVVNGHEFDRVTKLEGADNDGGALRLVRPPSSKDIVHHRLLGLGGEVLARVVDVYAHDLQSQSGARSFQIDSTCSVARI